MSLIDTLATQWRLPDSRSTSEIKADIRQELDKMGLPVVGRGDDRDAEHEGEVRGGPPARGPARADGCGDAAPAEAEALRSANAKTGARMDETKNRTASSADALRREYELTRTPVSKTEMDDRIKARETPRYETHLTPGGGVEQVVRQRLDADNERRINFIKKRLTRMKGTAKADHARSR